MLLEQAWNYLNDAKYNKAIKLCKDYLSSGEKEFELEANKLAALAYFQMKEFKKSLGFYKRIAEITNNSEDWFNLALATSLSSDNAMDTNAFQKAIDSFDESETSINTSIPAIRLFYLKELVKKKQYHTAFEQLNELRKIYEEHEITDETYLYMNNTPKFSEAMEFSTEILTHVLPENEAFAWLNEFAETLDEQGKELLLRMRENK